MLFFLIALLTLLQSATYLVVRQANRQHALDEIESRLRAGARIFIKLIEQRNQQIAGAAAIISRDHAFQQAFAGASQDRLTTLSALESLRSRVNADLVFIDSLENKLLFDSHRPDLHDVPFPFPKLIAKAEKSEAASAFVVIDDQLYAMAATPLLAPEPIAWLCSGFRIDDNFAREISTYTNLEITFLSPPKVSATTLEGRQRARLAAILGNSRPPNMQVTDLRLAGERFLSYSVSLPAENAKVAALLQRSLDQELAPYLKLERTYLVLALIGLVISVALGTWIARGVSYPVLELARGAHKIAEGDYRHRVRVKQKDELGLLAGMFNKMSDGLAERDRVRDLLGKVISPQVAAELLQRGMTLGGEEREVTVLFSDLRNFTGMCEALPPQEMLAILNHYFTRMAAVVERHGGVVDKYVGDALMALFGAPLCNSDDADHALKAALDMVAAVDDLNREWRARGVAAIGVGIGINTDVVVAGNMGSETRLNYTVIGDGVNLASRLEGLTKTPEYETRIIVSASTLAKARDRYRTRRLGEVAVRGKQSTTEIFALLDRETTTDREPNDLTS
ncbi:MAG TPA: adenylate/guanylate cyclase domain-containing protein [Chthoniobacterales bacterium]